jgi:hypothetical protein
LKHLQPNSQQLLLETPSSIELTLAQRLLALLELFPKSRQPELKIGLG